MTKILRALSAAVLAGGLLGACASGQAVSRGGHGGKSLYVRLGGLPAIKAVTHLALERIVKDPRVKDYFADADLGVLEPHFVQLVCVASGGPCKYEGHSMKEGHERLHVTNAAFDAVTEDILFTLKKAKVGGDEIDEVAQILNAQRADVVELK